MQKKKIQKKPKTISKTKGIPAAKKNRSSSKKKGSSLKKVKAVKARTTAKIAAKKTVVKKTVAKKAIAHKTVAAKVVKTKGTTAPLKAKKKLSQREKMLQGIKKKLTEQRNTLLSEAEEALNMLPGQTIFPDMGDQASAEIDRSFMLRLRGREQRLLKKIESAIEKIDSGAFGICDVCGEEIDIKRLEARPVTTMCIFCKKEQEEEEKLRGE